MEGCEGRKKLTMPLMKVDITIFITDNNNKCLSGVGWGGGIAPAQQKLHSLSPTHASSQNGCNRFICNLSSAIKVENASLKGKGE